MNNGFIPPIPNLGFCCELASSAIHQNPRRSSFAVLSPSFFLLRSHPTISVVIPSISGRRLHHFCYYRRLVGDSTSSTHSGAFLQSTQQRPPPVLPSAFSSSKIRKGRKLGLAMVSVVEMPWLTVIIRAEEVDYESSSNLKDAVLFVAISLVLGIASRHLLRGTRVLYTVALLILGIAMGSLEYGTSHQLGNIGDGIQIWADVDPDLLLAVFLPALLFESSFLMDVQLIKAFQYKIGVN